MTATSNKSRTIKALAVIAAGVTVGLGGAFVAAATTTDSANHDPRFGHTTPPELVQYARDHGLSGLSPASLEPTRWSAYDDIGEIEEYAHTNGSTGLSPASLEPVATNP